MLVRGRCPSCNTERLLPGRRADAAAICRDCAGITRDFFCDRCGAEGHLHGRRLCGRCALSDQLHRLLDDGTGQVHPRLAPLLTMILAMPEPKNRLAWLRSQQVQQLLRDLATGRVPLTHDELQKLENWRTVAHLRDLLMSAGVLPAVDKQLLHTQTWLHHRLATLTGNPHYRLLRQFGLWHQIPRLRTRAGARPLTEAARRFTAEQFTQAERFLAWLDQRDRRLGDCTQADLDAWHAQAAEHHKRAARMFLTWAITTHHMPKLALPTLNTRTGERLTQTRRLALLRRVLTDDGPPTPARAAAALILLYAQPATRIVRLTVDDILDLGDQMMIRLGEPPSPVPDPLTDILRHLVAGMPGATSTTQPAGRWLFPGTRPGQPTHPRHLLDLVRGLGIPAQATRVAALRQLVLQAPAPVIADALGYHTKHVAKVWTEAGGTWKTYAPGDHSK
jgi:hypothetical protein